LKFCHAFTIAPCTVSSREKCEKVCQAKKYNSSGDLDLARQLLHPPTPPRGGRGLADAVPIIYSDDYLFFRLTHFFYFFP